MNKFTFTPNKKRNDLVLAEENLLDDEIEIEQIGINLNLFKPQLKYKNQLVRDFFHFYSLKITRLTQSFTRFS